MKPVYDEVNYVLNDNGDIDVNYYISKAHNLRNEAIRAYSAKAGDAIKASLDYIASLFQQPKAA